MTLDQLKYFLEAAKHQHVGRAAKSIAISPSAISTAISTLESELGCKLFHRKSKRIGLTIKGERLMELADGLLKQVAEISGELKGEQVLVKKRYRVGASHSLSAKVMTPVWNELQKKYPGLTGELYSVNSASLISDVASGVFDIGLCFTPVKHSELEETVVYKGNLVIAVRKKHPILRHPPKLRLDHLSKYPGAAYRTPDLFEMRKIHPVLDKFQIDGVVDFFFDSDDIALERLKTTNSWGLLPDIVADFFSDDIVTLKPPTGWKAPVEICVIKHQARMLEEILEDMTTMIKSKFKT